MKKETNIFKLVLPSKSSNEAFARTVVAAFFAQLDPTMDEMADVKTAVSEAVTNAIVHGYRDSIGMIFITGRIFENRCIEITVKDKGCGIEDVKHAMEPTFTTSPNEERAGLGFSVMTAFMDTLRVRSKVGKGTAVRMTKYIKNKMAEQDGKAHAERDDAVERTVH